MVILVFYVDVFLQAWLAYILERREYAEAYDSPGSAYKLRQYSACLLKL
jgi:hypothetical protein